MNAKFVFLAILGVQFSGNKYIHDAVQLSPLTLSIFFKNRNSVPIKQ